MQSGDGNRLVESKLSRDVKVVGCSRWNELRDSIEYHTQMAVLLKAPTAFRMLNDPSCGPNSQQFGVAEKSLDKAVLQKEMDRANTIMRTAQPSGATPLIRCVNEDARSVKMMEWQLRARGRRVAIILATDGLPTDGNRESDVLKMPFDDWRGFQFGLWFVYALMRRMSWSSTTIWMRSLNYRWRF